MAFKFEKLKIWELSLELSDEVESIARSFPQHELFALASQIRRAANSVSLNIVEGSTGQSNAEFKRFLRIANRSALEVAGCLFLAIRRSYINKTSFDSIYERITCLVRMIQALMNAL
jgi:four helix bundle protein